jgi:hypothetical protein
VSVEVVVKAEIRTAEDLVEAVKKWVGIADPFDRIKFDGFVIGYADTRRAAVAEETKEE